MWLALAMHIGGLVAAGQVAASPGADWKSPKTATLQSELAGSARKYQAADPDKIYALYELIDIAEEQNPGSRAAWEALKVRAAAFKASRSELFPVAELEVPTVEAREFAVFPNALAPVLGGATLRDDVTAVNPLLALSYLIFDFGARRAAINAADANLSSAGMALNETHEQIALSVTLNFYKVVSTKGLVQAATASLTDAQSTEAQVQTQMANGLATITNYLSAQAQRAQAEYNLENATGSEEIAVSDLARSAGLNPALPLKVKDIQAVPQRSELEESVEKLINQALIRRPDLLEGMAEIQAADAEIKAARSTLYPKLNVEVEAGYDAVHTQTSAGDAPNLHQSNWRGQLTLSWEIFDARRRRYQIIEAESQKRAAQAKLDNARDQATNAVWSSYVAAKVAFRRLDTSQAVLKFATTSYEAARFSFDRGLETYIDVLNAEQTLAQARNEQVQAESQVLSDLAQLAYQTGDLLNSRFLQANRNEK